MTSEQTNLEYAQANESASNIHAQAYELLATKCAGFKTYRKTPKFTLQGPDLPCLSVFLLADREVPDGDSNHGEPHFKNTCSIAVVGSIAQSDMDKMLDMLKEKILACRLALYCDPAFVRRCVPEGSDLRLVLAATPGELPLAEYQLEMRFSYDTRWPPDVRDDYLRLTLITQFPIGDPEQAAKTLQVERHWDIDQNT